MWQDSSCKVGDTNAQAIPSLGLPCPSSARRRLDTLTVDKLESILAFANKAAVSPPAATVLFLPCPLLRKVEG